MVATIGFFDGVHLGHRQVLKRLAREAMDAGEQSLVVTFRTHPKPGKMLLSSLSERVARIKSCGIDHVEVLEFASVRDLTAAEFMRQVLKNQFHVSTLLMGYDHRFGSDQMSDFFAYQRVGEREGIRVVCLPQYAPQNKHISSSAVRCMLEQGAVDDANSMLGYCYALDGEVVEGRQIGRQIGFPTANILPCQSDKIIPGSGVYVVEVRSACWQGKQRGMLNIGTNPTVGGGHTTIEVHIFDYSGNLYGERLHIEFLHRLRGERTFASIDLLQQQLQRDFLAAQQWNKTDSSDNYQKL